MQTVAATLSDREIQVLKLVADGLTTAEIGSALHISRKTADSHRNRIMEKLDLHNAVLLTRYAIREGLVTP